MAQRLLRVENCRGEIRDFASPLGAALVLGFGSSRSTGVQADQNASGQ